MYNYENTTCQLFKFTQGILKIYHGSQHFTNNMVIEYLQKLEQLGM